MFVSYDVLGAELLAQGNLDEAKAQCLNGLAVIQKLAKQDPANTDWQYNLSDSHTGLGDVYRAQKDFDNALAEYQSALDISQKLTERDSTNSDWQHAGWRLSMRNSGMSC